MINKYEEDALKRDLVIKEGVFFPIGVSKTTRGIHFSVSVPHEKEIGLQIYNKGEDRPAWVIHQNQGIRFGNLWTVTLTGLDWTRYEYSYTVDGIPYQDAYARKVIDTHPFGSSIKADIYKYKLRYGFPFEEFDWEEDVSPVIPLEEVILYNLHVRGFTKDVSSKVKNKGTFAGVIEKLPYLKSLGINQIELMPAYDFYEVLPLNGSLVSSETKVNYWGYSSGHYFAPKGSYSTGENPSVEFKNLVKASHKAGIEVVMEFYFPEGTNGILILDCLRYWAMEYHIDGFHVNGSGISLKEILADPVLSKVKLYATGIILKGDEAKRPAANYHHNFSLVSRKLLRGEEDQLQSFSFVSTYQGQGAGVINYITEHNGFTLKDLVSYDQKHNEANGEQNRDGNDYNFSWNCGEEGSTKKKKVLSLRTRQIKNAMAMLFLSKGIPMLFSGDEMGNSQMGNNNAYCQDNPIGWVQWNQRDCAKMKAYVKKLIHLRKEHPVIWKNDAMEMVSIGRQGYPKISFHGSTQQWHMGVTDRHIGIMYWEEKGSGKGKNRYDIVFVAYNFHWESHEFLLPKLPENVEWCICVDTSQGEETDEITENETKKLVNQQKLLVSERTVVVLEGKVYDNE